MKFNYTNFGVKIFEKQIESSDDVNKNVFWKKPDDAIIFSQSVNFKNIGL